ncbi:hypothetical protein J1N35_041378, partial [Gossypium stocksii]
MHESKFTRIFREYNREYKHDIDLGFKGRPFTCCSEGLCERLDRAIGNDAWMRTFPYCSVTYLSRIKSNNKPLLLAFELEVNLSKGRPFRFLAGWVKHPKFSNFVKEKSAFKDNM